MDLLTDIRTAAVPGSTGMYQVRIYGRTTRSRTSKHPTLLLLQDECGLLYFVSLLLLILILPPGTIFILVSVHL